MAVYKVNVAGYIFYSNYNDNYSLISVSSHNEMSIIADELMIDTFEFVGRYTGDFVNIRAIAYGATVTFYIDNVVKDIYYLESVERTAKYQYKFNCISKVGLWDHQYNRGGMFINSTFKSVLQSIFSNTDVPTIRTTALEDTKIYGWLPYGTIRDLLRQLLFAVNAHLFNVNGTYEVGFLDTTSSSVADANVFDVGGVTYPDKISKVTVTEHSYYYLPTTDRVVLFDNSDGFSVSSLFVVFSNAPVYKDSISAEGGLTFTNATVNTAVVTGRGKLTGIPYIHKTLEVYKENTSAPVKNEITVTDATLISVANSEAVASRIYDYNRLKNEIDVDFVHSAENTGKYISFKNAFSESSTGFIAKMDKVVSSFLRASCKVISNFSAASDSYKGNNYTNKTILTSTSSATWTRPSGVTKIRVVLIGGGNGGTSGTAGEEGGAQYPGRGGKGGKGGARGLGGKIRIVTINDPASSYTYQCGAGGASAAQCTSTTTPNAGGTGGVTTFGTHSSNDGLVSEDGFVDVFTGQVYALPGLDGYDGGDGGDGGSTDSGINAADSRRGKDGETVTWPNGTIDYGGAGADGYQMSFTYANGGIGAGGGGGGGGTAIWGRRTAVAQTAGDGTAATGEWTYTASDHEEGYITPGSGGYGAPSESEASSIPPRSGTYGSGGNGGHGGGGGGAAGGDPSGVSRSDMYGLHDLKSNGSYYYSNGLGARGGVSSAGRQGCIIIYY